MNAVQLGTEEHKRLFCRAFIDTHLPYRPAEIAWPELDGASLERLRSLPVWDEAAHTERDVAVKVQALAARERDPELRQAIALQGYEEARHSEMIDRLTRHYGIELSPRPQPRPPANPEWAFTRVGYGECFDSFFAFGLFAIARESGFFPPALVEIFEPVMQEEARHIVFFANWIAYRRNRTPIPGRPFHAFQCGLAIALQVLSRIRTALGARGSAADQDNFAMKAHTALAAITPRSFVDRCLQENARRLAPYDERLLRPEFVPRLARFSLRFLKDDRPPAPQL